MTYKQEQNIKKQKFKVLLQSYIENCGGYDKAKTISLQYRKICRGVDMDNAPQYIQESALVLLQHSTMVWAFEKYVLEDTL